MNSKYYHLSLQLKIFNKKLTFFVLFETKQKQRLKNTAKSNKYIQFIKKHQNMSFIVQRQCS